MDSGFICTKANASSSLVSAAVGNTTGQQKFSLQFYAHDNTTLPKAEEWMKELSFNELHFFLLCISAWFVFFSLALTVIQVWFVVKNVSSENLRSPLLIVVFQCPLTVTLCLFGMTMPRGTAFISAIVTGYDMICLYVCCRLAYSVIGGKSSWLRSIRKKKKTYNYFPCMSIKINVTRRFLRILEVSIFQTTAVRVCLEVIDNIVHAELHSRDSGYFLASGVIGFLSVSGACYAVFKMTELSEHVIGPYGFDKLCRCVALSQLIFTLQKMIFDFVLVKYDVMQPVKCYGHVNADILDGSAHAMFIFMFMHTIEIPILCMVGTYLIHPLRNPVFDKYIEKTNKHRGDESVIIVPNRIRNRLDKITSMLDTNMKPDVFLRSTSLSVRHSLTSFIEEQSTQSIIESAEPLSMSARSQLWPEADENQPPKPAASSFFPSLWNPLQFWKWNRNNEETLLNETSARGGTFSTFESPEPTAGNQRSAKRGGKLGRFKRGPQKTDMAEVTARSDDFDTEDAGTEQHAQQPAEAKPSVIPPAWPTWNPLAWMFKRQPETPAEEPRESHSTDNLPEAMPEGEGGDKDAHPGEKKGSKEKKVESREKRGESKESREKSKEGLRGRTPNRVDSKANTESRKRKKQQLPAPRVDSKDTVIPSAEERPRGKK